MFDKKAYAERRKQGLRGQGDLAPPPALAKWTEEDLAAGKCGAKAVGSDRTSDVTMHMTKKGLIAVTRKMNRRKMVDRDFTHAGHAYGRRIGSKIFNIIRHKLKRDIGANFGKIIDTEIEGRLVNRKYTFPVKSRHLRSVSQEQITHLQKNPLKVDPSKTNHQRMLERKANRDERRV